LSKPWTRCNPAKVPIGGRLSGRPFSFAERSETLPEFLPDLPVADILSCLNRAPGGEVKSGKFDLPDSSAALVANAFGWFLHRPRDLPPLPGVPAGQAVSVTLEAEMRFPWAGGRHPWLDVGIATATTLIGVESKRYEPFRPQKHTGFSDVYDRPVWGARMAGFTRLRDDLVAGRVWFHTLDAAQLIKHAYGIRTRAEKRALGGVLVYLYAEPPAWGSGKPVDASLIALHRQEVAVFADRVIGGDVAFAPLAWADLLDQWGRAPELAAHVAALRGRFGDLGQVQTGAGPGAARSERTT
jgi:hypothetical protein